MGWLFGSIQRKISRLEFQKIKSSLRIAGFTMHEVNTVEEIFLGSMSGNSDYQKGIDKNEFARTIKWMKQNHSKHNLSDHQIDTIEATMLKYL